MFYLTHNFLVCLTHNLYFISFNTDLKNSGWEKCFGLIIEVKYKYIEADYLDVKYVEKEYLEVARSRWSWSKF